MERSLQQAVQSYLKWVYNSEDTLYQLLYDECHRPEVYRYRTTGENPPDSHNFTSQKHKQLSFIETRFLEQTNTIRVGLLQKVPFALCGVLGFWLTKKVRLQHATMISKGMYIRADSTGKKVNNSLQVVSLILMLINLASLGAGFCLCGFQYAKSLKRRYFTPIEFEEQLIRKHLDEIRLYRQHPL